MEKLVRCDFCHKTRQRGQTRQLTYPVHGREETISYCKDKITCMDNARIVRESGFTLIECSRKFLI